jgi:hypothetical protein
VSLLHCSSAVNVCHEALVHGCAAAVWQSHLLAPCAADGDAAAEPPDWLVSVVTGEVALPVDTYILGGYGEGCGLCAVRKLP